MKSRWFTGAVVCAAVVLALAAAVSAAEPGKEPQVKIVKVIKQKPGESAKGAWLGVQLQDVSTGVARAMGLNAKEGALVADVQDGSPADDAGLQNGDVITKFEGRNVGSAADLTKMVRAADPGDKVSLTIVRDGKTKRLQVALGDLADRNGGGEGEEEAANDDSGIRNDGNVWYFNSPGNKQMKVLKLHVSDAYLGVELQNLSDQLGDFFGVKDGKGALISRVVEDSPAEAAGLKAGDVITKVGDEEIGDPSDVTQQLSDLKPGDSVNITYVGDRGNSEKTITVELARRPAGQKQMMMLDNNGDLPEIDMKELQRLHQIPGMRRHLQGLDGLDMAPGTAPDVPGVPGLGRERLRQQMTDLREQLQELRDQLQELRDQLHEEKDR